MKLFRILPKRIIASQLTHERYCVVRKSPGGGRARILTEKGKLAGLVAEAGHISLSEARRQFIYDNLQKIFDYCKTL